MFSANAHRSIICDSREQPMCPSWMDTQNIVGMYINVYYLVINMNEAVLYAIYAIYNI